MTTSPEIFPMTTSTRNSRTTRLLSIDLARFLAIVGMITTHVWNEFGVPSWSPLAWPVGNASTLFAVLGGASVVLASRRNLRDVGVGAARWALVGRGVAVVTIGLTLGLITPAPIVVLVYFGIAIICSVPFLTAPTWALSAAAAALAVGGGTLNAAVRSTLEQPQEYGSINWVDLAHPLHAIGGVFLTGVYPVITWLVYVLVGMLLCRALLRATSTSGTLTPRFALRLAGMGAALLATTVVVTNLLYYGWGRAALSAQLPNELVAPFGVDAFLRAPGWGSTIFDLWSLLLDSPHTGTFFDITRGVGCALLVIGLCLLVPDRWLGSRWLGPLRCAGAAPLTNYALHIVLFWVTTQIATLGQQESAPWYAIGPIALLLHLLVVLVVGAALSRLGRRGPLEAGVSWVARSAGRLGRRRSTAQ